MVPRSVWARDAVGTARMAVTTRVRTYRGMVMPLLHGPRISESQTRMLPPPARFMTSRDKPAVQLAREKHRLEGVMIMTLRGVRTLLAAAVLAATAAAQVEPRRTPVVV